MMLVLMSMILHKYQALILVVALFIGQIQGNCFLQMVGKYMMVTQKTYMVLCLVKKVHHFPNLPHRHPPMALALESTSRIALCLG